MVGVLVISNHSMEQSNYQTTKNAMVKFLPHQLRSLKMKRQKLIGLVLTIPMIIRLIADTPNTVKGTMIILTSQGTSLIVLIVLFLIGLTFFVGE